MKKEEYDLKVSTKIGQLYPVLTDKHGNIIDGYHRLDVDPSWRTEKLDWIDDKEKFVKAKIIANLHRRVVPATQIKRWIVELAEIATEKGIEPGKISLWIAEETGYARDTVSDYLPKRFKIQSNPGKSKIGAEPISLEAIQEQSLERFLNDYAEALTKYPKQSKKDETTTFMHIIKSMLQKQKLHCPICNEEHVTWKCGHEF